MPPSTAAQLREGNLTRALHWLHLAEGEHTRAGLARALAVTPATAGVLAGELAQMGLIEQTPAAPSGRRGRPTTRLEHLFGGRQRTIGIARQHLHPGEQQARG